MITMPASTGKLHIRLPQAHVSALQTQNFVDSIVNAILGLGKAIGLFSPSLPRSSDGFGWVTFSPITPSTLHPWDAAHQQSLLMASTAGSMAIPNVYVEPDLDHSLEGGGVHNMQRAVPGALATGQPPRDPVDAHYAPAVTQLYSPAWHLEQCKFPAAWGMTQGAGIRIGHADTGYTPLHVSTPLHIHPLAAANFFDAGNFGPDDVVDRGDHLNFGHGTATLALLAGNKVNLVVGDGVTSGGAYAGFIGGAPMAEIIPAKIGGVFGGVAHLFSESLAQGLAYMLDPPDHKQCDVVSLSHGGLPTASWATVVNRLYEAGIVLVAAAGDSYQGPFGAFPTHQTFYPSAFYRVITATGITYDSKPYTSASIGELQGCWGPDALLEKSIAAPAPNVPWMLAGSTPTAWDNDGAGTSASTPQVAAACALWLAQYGAKFPNGWQRVSACRRALYESSSAPLGNSQIGIGQLNVEAMLSPSLANLIIAAGANNQLEFIEPDAVSFPLLRLLFDLPPPGQAVGEMCETEALQLVYTSPDPHLRELVRQNFNASSVDPANAAYMRSALKSHPDISSALAGYLNKPTS